MEIRMPKVIIIGNPLDNTYGMMRSLYRGGIKPIVVVEPTKFKQFKYSKYPSTVHYLKSYDELIPLLLEEYGNEMVKPVLLCGSDPSVCLLDKNYNLLKNKFVFFNCGKQGMINHFMDKINTFDIANKNGFSIIKTWLYQKGENLPEDIIYPCLIKGSNSTHSTKLDMFICRTAEELRNYIKPDVEYLIQEYIEKEYELDIIGIAYNQGKDVYIPGAVRKIRDEIHRQSVYIRLDNIKDYPLLDNLDLAGFIRDINYEGIFSIEVIYSNGKFYFLEVNLRNDGCGWIYTAGGVNYPLLWALYSNGNLNQQLLNKIAMKSPLYLMGKNDIYNLFEGAVSLKQWLKDLARAKAFFSPGIKDPLCFSYCMVIHVRQAFKKLLRKTLKTR